MMAVTASFTVLGMVMLLAAVFMGRRWKPSYTFEFAFIAVMLGLEPRVGAMLPCNVILRAVDGGVEVSAIDPLALMQAIDNADLHAVAGQVRDMLAQMVAEV